MKAQDLRNGEFGIVTDGSYKGVVIKRGDHGFFGLSDGSFYNSMSGKLQVDKLENFKITYDGYKSEYPKMMNVWHNNKQNNLKIVLGEFRGQFIVESNEGTFEVFKHAEDIIPEKDFEVTFAQIAEKFNVKVENLKVKKE